MGWCSKRTTTWQVKRKGRAMQMQMQRNKRFEVLTPGPSTEAVDLVAIERYLSDLADELPVERFEDYFQDLQTCNSPEIKKRVLTVMRCLIEARESLTAGR